MSHPVLAFDGGWKTTLEAEHSLYAAVQALGLQVRLACSHFVRAGGARVVVAAEVTEASASTVTDPWPLVRTPTGDLATSVLAQVRRSAGRAFVYPGSQQMHGDMTVRDLLARSGIDRVIGLGGVAVDDSSLLETQDFVRPCFVGGNLQLTVRPSVEGRLVPFEQPNPTPCCADHP